MCNRYLGLFVCYWCGLLSAQPQPSVALLSRVYLIEYKNERGTVFSIDIDDREYWVTARHILTGAKGKPYGTVSEKNIQAKLLNPGGDGEQWISEKFGVLQPESDVDVVVLVPHAPILKDPPVSPPATSSSVFFGESCEFLGFAYGGGWKLRLPNRTVWLPYIKHCIISGADMDSKLWILDGINNAGFSGGPVIAGTGTDLKIVAIISGYHSEPTAVMRGNSSTATSASQETVNINSGFILAYDISHAEELIKSNPIGPKRTKR
jgi:hypothetical protein